MKRSKHGPARRSADLSDPATAIEALSNWDELDSSVLSAIEVDPHLRPRLEMLQTAERYLESLGTREGRTRERGLCPAADELYDFGRGPGYRQMERSRRTYIDRHLSQCAECESFVETLAIPPPLPLEIDRGHARDWDEEFPRSTAAPIHPLRRPRRFRLALAAAAAVVLALGAWWTWRANEMAEFRPTPQPVLRGEASGLLLYPRERLLAPSEAVRTAWPFARAIRFEIDPVAGATEYRVALSHRSDAFAVGEPIQTANGAEPVLSIELPRAAGRYTWRAWAVVDGLDRSLGARDFEVVAAADVIAALEASLTEAMTDSARVRAVEILDANGFVADARAVASELPPSVERDAYLQRRPGR